MTMADRAIGSPAQGGVDRRASRASLVDSRYAWWRLFICLLISTIGGAGLWCIVVVIPEAEVDFKVDRATASLSYTACMTGFALGGLLAGRLVDRFGVFVPLVLAAVAVGTGFYAAAFSDTTTTPADTVAQSADTGAVEDTVIVPQKTLAE